MNEDRPGRFFNSYDVCHLRVHVALFYFGTRHKRFATHQNQHKTYISSPNTMGGRHSRHRDAFTNDLQSEDENNDGKKKEQSRQKSSIQCCNGFFVCPIPTPLASVASPPSSLSRANSGHTATTSGSGGGVNGGGIFGTPIPDTPILNRRMRDNAVMEKYYHTGNFDLSEEKKSTSPGGVGVGAGRGVVSSGNHSNNISGKSFGRGGRFAIDNYVSSSKYMGLEKEVSDSFPIGQQNGNAVQQTSNAEIRDGPVRYKSILFSNDFPALD